MKKREDTGPVTTFSFVGNPGCIRFPIEIRKASGIKRGDRLSVQPRGEHGILLERLDIPRWLEIELVSVDGCVCQQAPEGCSGGREAVVTVGWSYVKLSEEMTRQLGFEAGVGLKLIAEPSRIIVTLHSDERDLEGAVRLPCPP